MKTALLLILAISTLAACNSMGDDDPAQTVERYLQAKVDSDSAVISQLLCSEMESLLQREVQAFDSVEAHIENMTCSADGSTVTCIGSIVATYGTEDVDFPLEGYRVVQEDGEWKWCGEASI